MKKIFVLAAAMLAAAIFLMSPAGMSAAAETGAGLAFTGTLSGERAVIRNRDGAKLVLDNVMKVEEENGWLTVYVLKDVPYQVDADSFAMAIANSGDFNQVPGSRYKLYWKNADGSRGAATGETVDTAELLERGIVAIDNPTREEKHWEILPNRSSGTMTGLRGTYIVQLSDENIFSSTQRWEEAFFLKTVSGPDSSEIADVVKTVPVEGEGRWEYLSNGRRRFLREWAGEFSSCIGWQQIAGKWYDFYPYSGGDESLDIYDMVTGWVSGGPNVDNSHGLSGKVGGMYYLQEDGSLKTGWVQRDGNWYYLDPETLWYRTGWFQDTDGSWYYLSPKDGKMYTGWLWENGKWYFLGEGGRMYDNGWRPTSPSMDGVVMLGQWEGFHYFWKDGSMATGWQLIETLQGDEFIDAWYYFNPDGSRYNGWLQWNGRWYYLKDGSMETDTVIGGYRLNSDGVWVP